MTVQSLIKTAIACFLLFPGGTAYSQENLSAMICSRFVNYRTSVPWEEIYLHTDRDSYIAGEDIWFSISLLDRQTMRISENSSIAYVELLSPGNNPVVQKRFRLDRGSGPGQFSLPDTLTPGTYTLRAYTGWMRNFLPVNSFMKEIDIYNPYNARIFKRRILLPGDYLQAYSVNEHRTDIVKTEYQKLPGGGLRIKVITNKNLSSPDSGRFLLFIQTRGTIDLSKEEEFRGDTTGIIIPPGILTPGINHITLFDNTGKPLAEKLVYTPLPDGVNLINIDCPDSMARRGRIRIGLHSPGSDLARNLSVSVTPATGGINDGERDIYWLFGSEYGISPYNHYRSNPSGSISDDEIDSLLTGLKSYWLSWDKILSGKIHDLRYGSEKEFHEMRGLLLAEGNQLGYPGEMVTVSSPGKTALFQYAVTDHEASFRLSLPVVTSNQNLIIQPADTSKNYRIFPESPFPGKYIPAIILTDTFPKAAIDHVKRMSLNYQVSGIYGQGSGSVSLNETENRRPAKRFYGKPDFELVMKDYVRLPTMEEVFFELVPRVRLRKNFGRYEITMLDYNGNPVYDEPATVMIDGVIFRDISVIARLDPDVVEKIDVIRGIYHSGGYSFYGIVNIITNAGDLIRLPLPEYAARISFRTVDPVMIFKSPDHSSATTEDERTPDLRNTLFWDPSVKLVREKVSYLEFHASDIQSEYIIEAAGFTEDGKLISSRKSFIVK